MFELWFRDLFKDFLSLNSDTDFETKLKLSLGVSVPRRENRECMHIKNGWWKNGDSIPCSYYFFQMSSSNLGRFLGSTN